MRLKTNFQGERDVALSATSGVWVPIAVPGRDEGAGESVVVQLELPMMDVQGYWQPHLCCPKMQLDWVIDFHSAVNYGFPFLSFFNTSHQNKLCVGVSDPVRDIRIRADMDQTNNTYRIEIRIATEMQKSTVLLWLDTSERQWTQSLADYSRQVIQSAGHYPAASWRPVFCTWYARHRRINQAWVEKTAASAARLGFGTFILDDGWSCEDSSTVNPATLANWYAPIGDWCADPKKFPDFSAHVARVRGMGLRYMVWVAPLMLGVDTELGRRLRAEREPVTGFVNIDPRREDETSYVLQAMQRLVNSASLDGLKLDFLDEIKPSLAQPNGRAMHALMEKLSALIRMHNPDAMIEYRQNYAGPATAKLATNFRALDVPYDFVSNLHRIAQIRLSLGDGVPVHADPAFWHPEETPLNIARHLIASLAGVPMISMDLIELPAGALKMIRHWLNVYDRYEKLFRTGHWDILYDFDRVGAMTVTCGEQALALVYSASMWQQLKSERSFQCIINGSDRELELACRRPGQDMFGDPFESSSLPPGALCFSHVD